MFLCLFQDKYILVSMFILCCISVWHVIVYTYFERNEDDPDDSPAARAGAYLPPPNLLPSCLFAKPRRYPNFEIFLSCISRFHRISRSDKRLGFLPSFLLRLGVFHGKIQTYMDHYFTWFDYCSSTLNKEFGLLNFFIIVSLQQTKRRQATEIRREAKRNETGSDDSCEIWTTWDSQPECMVVTQKIGSIQCKPHRQHSG